MIVSGVDCVVVQCNSQDKQGAATLLDAISSGTPEGIVAICVGNCCPAACQVHNNLLQVLGAGYIPGPGPPIIHATQSLIYISAVLHG